MSQHAFIQHLIKDHQEQKRLGKQLVEATDSKERHRLRKELYNELHPHMIGEEASLFERLQSASEEDARDDGLEGLQEHHVSKFLLRELMEMDTDGAIFKAKAKVLDELNRHHIEEEEEDVFAHIQRLCSKEELDELFEQYEQAEEEDKA